VTRLVPRLDRTGPDFSIKEGDDFTPTLKKTLNDFLKSAVDDPVNGKKESDDRQFADQTELAAHSNTTFFNLLDGSDYSRLRSMLDDNIRSSVGKKDIIAAIEGTLGGSTPADDESAQSSPEAAVVVGSVSRILTQNRFTPANTFGDQFDDDGHIASMPTALGSYDQEGASARLDSLKKVGLSLMMRATGEFIDGDPTSPGVSLGSLLPGQAQLGVRIDVGSMHAENVFGAPGRDPNAGRPRTRIKDIITGKAGEGTRSYGQLNSSNEPFAGFMPLGMISLALVLVIALRLVATGLVRMIGLIASKPMGPGGGKLSSDGLELGQYGRITTSRPLVPIKLSDIGIMELDRDFTACVDEGLKVFFELNGAAGFATGIGRVSKSPGFYANMVRVIIQSSARIITDVIDAFKSLGGGNIVAGVQAVLGIIDVLKTSKVIAFLNIMAVLGDRSFARQESGVDDAPRGSIVDAIPENEASRIMKSKVRHRGRVTLAWRGSAPVSSLIFPREVQSAAKTLSHTMTRYSAACNELGQGLVENDGDTRETSRLTAAQVEAVEASLDAEYVPFYFHDLRTNEIISFHAFIGSVNESFTPTYSETTPYGRIDPIMTYGGTRREFSLSFHAVATSPEDFDLMYVKLNKLATLLYPQWTRGRTVVDAEQRQFTQPFSQVPGASPMCRIRLGNLVKSNFSNLALARLFGLGSQEFLDKDPAKVPTPKTFDQILETMQKQVETSGFLPGQEATLLPGYFKQTNEHSGLLPPAIAALSSDPDKLRNFNRVATRPSAVLIKQPSLTRTRHMGEESRTYVVELKEKGLEGTTLTVPEAYLAISTAEVEKFVVLATPPSLPGMADPKLTFLEIEQNAIVRSFRNVQGKGLPGFITSMNCDWNDGRWDVERFFARAPQLVKIDIAFTVIHDIAPGIDADGFNRAPIWPTGDIAGRMFGDVYDTSGRGKDRFDEAFGKIKGKL